MVFRFKKGKKDAENQGWAARCPRPPLPALLSCPREQECPRCHIMEGRGLSCHMSKDVGHVSCELNPIHGLAYGVAL